MSLVTWIFYFVFGFLVFLGINLLKERYSFTKIQSLVFSLFFVLIVAGVSARIGLNNFNENIFLILVFKFIIELFYNMYFLENDFFNKEDSNVKWAIIEIVLMFILNQELINKVNDVFLSGENLKIIVWLFVLGYIYNFYKNCSLVNKTITNEEKIISKESIVVSFARCRLDCGEDVKLKNEKNKLIVYAIMILNNYERPKILRKFDNAIFKINGAPKKLGIMQVSSKKFITDSESIELVCKKIDKIGEKVKDNKKDSYKDIFMSYDKKNSDKLIYIYEELKKFSVL